MLRCHGAHRVEEMRIVEDPNQLTSDAVTYGLKLLSGKFLAAKSITPA